MFHAFPYESFVVVRSSTNWKSLVNAIHHRRDRHRLRRFETDGTLAGEVYKPIDLFFPWEKSFVPNNLKEQIFARRLAVSQLTADISQIGTGIADSGFSLTCK